MTNLVAIAGAVVSGVVGINWTIILSVITVCLTAMATIVKIFGSKQGVNDEDLRQSNYLKEMETKAKDNNTKSESLKECISSLRTEIAKIKVEQTHNTRSLSELRIDNRELVQRLDDLLRQLVEWID